jgi:hypothetical protein
MLKFDPNLLHNLLQFLLPLLKKEPLQAMAAASGAKGHNTMQPLPPGVTSMREKPLGGVDFWGLQLELTMVS